VTPTRASWGERLPSESDPGRGVVDADVDCGPPERFIKAGAKFQTEMNLQAITKAVAGVSRRWRAAAGKGSYAIPLATARPRREAGIIEGCSGRHRGQGRS